MGSTRPPAGATTFEMLRPTERGHIRRLLPREPRGSVCRHLNANPNANYAATAEAQVNRLYDTVFARDPDAVGFNANDQAVINGTSLHDVAMTFLQSAEFTGRYGQPSHTAFFVGTIYTNAVGYPPPTAPTRL